MLFISSNLSNNTVYVRSPKCSLTFTFDDLEKLKNFVEKVKNAESTQDEEYVTDLLKGSVRETVNEYLEKDIHGKLYIKGLKSPLTDVAQRKLEEFITLGLDIEPVVNFHKLVSLNPDPVVRDRLYNFAERYNFPITSEGYFIAYKAVKYKEYLKELFEGSDPLDDTEVSNDQVLLALEQYQNSKESLKATIINENQLVFTDIHTMTMDIQLGVPVSLDRSECDTDSDNCCSYGLHLGTLSYAMDFGGLVPFKEGDSISFNANYNTVLLSAICSPVDVVAVPEYGGRFEKLRTSRYLPYSVCTVRKSSEGYFVEEFQTPYAEKVNIPYVLEYQEMLEEFDQLKNAEELTEIDQSKYDILQQRLVNISHTN